MKAYSKQHPNHMSDPMQRPMVFSVPMRAGTAFQLSVQPLQLPVLKPRLVPGLPPFPCYAARL